MNTIAIVTLIAILLFARMGVRLFPKYRSMKREEIENDDSRSPDRT